MSCTEKALLNGVTPLMKGHASVTRLLVDVLSSSDINKYYDITICDLPSEYHTKIEAFFKFLKKDVPTKLQVSPLMIALLLGKTESTECMELLINKKGVDPTLGILIDNENITPLKCAMWLKNKDEIALLQNPPKKQSELLKNMGFMQESKNIKESNIEETNIEVSKSKKL